MPQRQATAKRQRDRDHDAKRRAQYEWRGLYHTARWLRVRAAQLAEHPLCHMCLERGVVTAANTADHVVPHRGDETLFWCGELQSLCTPCHNGDKQREEHGGTRRGVDAQGYPTDPNHPWNV